jgi:hypothetical protein
MDLKTILGAAHTAELEKALNEAIGKDFVARSDFNQKNGTVCQRVKRMLFRVL